MLKRMLRICSMVLTIVLVINLLPVQALGEIVFTEKQTVIASDESLSANATVTAPAEEEPAYIVGEIEERRTEHSKEYRLSNACSWLWSMILLSIMTTTAPGRRSITP